MLPVQPLWKQTNLHLLLKCPYSLQVWELRGSMEISFEFNSTLDFVSYTFKSLNGRDYCLYLIILWMIWMNRNKARIK